ncbi:MAG: hypothetical protein OHK0046_38340 [Anaerolineae bacterium]
MMGGFHMGGGWFWLTFIVVMLLLIGYFAFQASSNNMRSEPTDYQKRKGQRKTAREIADERYANGEISREEYNTIIEDLEHDHAAS